MSYDRCLQAILLVVLGLTLTSCAGSPGKLSVDLAGLKECQKLGRSVPSPTFDERTDYADLSAESLGAISRANRGIAARTRCENQVIENYARAGK